MFLTAAEIGRRAEGRALGYDALVRYERVCKTLVDHEMAWPQNHPLTATCYRLREVARSLSW